MLQNVKKAAKWYFNQAAHNYEWLSTGMMPLNQEQTRSTSEKL